MADSPRLTSPTTDREIESDLRARLARLIREVDRGSALLGFAMIVFLPALIILFSIYVMGWGVVPTIGYGTLIWLSLTIVMVVFSCRDETAKIRRTAAALEEDYPPGTPRREQALTILGEMESPSGIERKLLNCLAVGAPEVNAVESTIVRRPSARVEDEIQRQIGVPDTAVEPAPAASSILPPEATGKAHPEQFDFIPLEPFSPDEEPDKGGSR